MFRIIGYIAAIAIANVLTAAFHPTQIGPLAIPPGSYLIGATFILRDLVQRKYGRKNTYMIIGIALAVSAISSYLLNDPLTIVVASAITFAVAETADTEIYTRLKLPLHSRVMYSGLVGGTFDSVIFVIIGLSPIGAGFVPWDMVIWAILGQLIIKIVMQGIGATGIYLYGKQRGKLIY